MTSSSIMYYNNESYIAVEQPKNLIVWRNILKKAQKKRSHRQNQYPPQKKYLGGKMGRMPPHPSQNRRWYNARISSCTTNIYVQSSI